MRRIRIIHAHPILLHPDIHKLSGLTTEVLDRFEYYASNFIAQGGKGKLVIFLNCKEDVYQELLARESSNLLIFRIGDPGTSITFFILKINQIIRRERLRPSIFIAGDLKRGLIASIFLKTFHGFRFRIQVSIHGIPFGFRHEGSQKIVRIMPWLYLRIILRFVDSVRIVSIHLQKIMQESFQIHDSKIFIAPIPIIHKPNQLDKSTKPINIGIIGRLHHERGIFEILRILNICLLEFPNTRVTFFGSGDLYDYINEWKVKNDQMQFIKLKGHISPAALLGEWPQITHLLSAAPSEGYGLSIREALLSGSIVIARSNGGTIEIKREFVSGIYLYDTEEKACEILMQILEGVKNFSYCRNAHIIQAKIDSSAIIMLAKSWLH